MTGTDWDPWERWLLYGRHGDDPKQREKQTERWRQLCERVLENAQVQDGDVVVDLGSGQGNVAFGAAERVGERGKVIFVDVSQGLLDRCRELAGRMGVLDRCEFLHASAEDLSALPDASIDAVTTRAVLMYVTDKPRAFREIHRVLRPGGRLSSHERINRFGQPEPRHLFWGYDVSPVQDLADRVRDYYDRLQPPETNPMFNFDERDLLAWAEEAGFAEVYLELQAEIGPPAPTEWDVLTRVTQPPPYPPVTLAEAMEQTLTPEDAERFGAHLRRSVEAGRGKLRWASAYLWTVK